MARAGLDTFSTQTIDGWEVVCRPDLDPQEALRHVLVHREQALAGTTQALKTGSTTATAKATLEIRSGPLEVATKWFQWRGLRRGLGNLFYGSRVNRALKGAQRITGLGLETPATVAVVERRRMGLVIEGLLVTEFLGDARSLAEELCHLVKEPEAAGHLAVLLGTGLGTLHAAGVSHPDLKISNVMVRPGGPRLSWIDLDSLIPPRRLKWSRRVRALGQLEAYTRYLAPWIPEASREAFLDAYCARDEAAAARRDDLVSEACEWAKRKVDAWEERTQTLPPDRLPPAESPRPLR